MPASSQCSLVKQTSVTVIESIWEQVSGAFDVNKLALSLCLLDVNIICI